MATQSVATQEVRARGRLGQLSDRTILILIIILAVFLRVASAVMQGSQVKDLPGVFDQISYDGLAQRVAGGYGFSFAEDHWPATRAGEPTAHWSYLYTLYLATLYKLFGIQPFIARLLQAMITGVLQTLFTWRIGRRIFGEKVGLLAAASSAVYIYFFYYAGALITESFYIVGILWTLDAAFRVVSASREVPKDRSRIRWLELGLAIGFTVLLRQLFFLFLPFLFVWIWWNVQEQPAGEEVQHSTWKYRIHWSAIKGLTVVIMVLALLVAPWTFRNYQAFRTFVLLNTNAGFAFYWGNHPIHGTQFIPILPAEQYRDLIPTELLPLNEAELDKALLKSGIQFVLDDPGRYLLLSISRMEEYFKFWPSKDSGLVSNLSRVGSFGLFLPLMVYGIWLSITQVWQSRAERERQAIGLLLVFSLVYTVIHLFSWTLIRYRLPVDAVLLLFAAIGIEKLTNIFRFPTRNKNVWSENSGVDR
ncbi:MAG: ArnT family glycosyltransferase [Anaerolineales bacterium]